MRGGGLAAAAGLGAALAGCGSTAYPNPGGQQLQVTAHDYFFAPSRATVHPGLVTVTLVNAGSVEHSFTADQVHGSNDADPGEDNTIAFTAPDSGTIAFHCRWHRQMTGTLVVVPANAPSPAPSPTPGTGH